MKILNGEVTHKAAKAFTNNAVSFDFIFMAPATGGHRDALCQRQLDQRRQVFERDNAVSITKAITVTASSTPDAGTGTPDAGTGTAAATRVTMIAAAPPRVARRCWPCCALIAAAGLRRRTV